MVLPRSPRAGRPALRRRMLNHWDNVAVHPVMGQVERGYAGGSICARGCSYGAYFSTQSDRFLTSENLSLVLQQVMVVGEGEKFASALLVLSGPLAG